MLFNNTETPFHFAIANDPIGSFILLTVFILQEVVGNALLLGLLWFARHGQDLQRTLYNQVFHMSFSCVFLTNITTQVLEFIILFYSPGFPEWFCSLRDLAIKVTLIYGALFSVQLAILKYCYVILWKRVIAMDDDFMAMYMLTLNLTIGSLGALLDHFWNGPHPAAMCLCMDVDWSTYYYPRRFKDHTPGVIMFLGMCFLFDMGVALRVSFHSIASNSRRTPLVHIQEPTQKFSMLKSCSERFQNIFCGREFTNDIVSLGVSSIGHWVYVISLVPLALFPVTYEDNPGALNEFPLSLYYILAFVGPSLILFIFLPMIYYWKHPEILNSILISMHDDIHDIKCC